MSQMQQFPGLTSPMQPGQQPGQGNVQPQGQGSTGGGGGMFANYSGPASQFGGRQNTSMQPANGMPTVGAGGGGAVTMPASPEMLELRKELELVKQLLMDKQANENLGMADYQPGYDNQGTVAEIRARANANAGLLGPAPGFAGFRSAGPDPRKKRATGRPGKYSPGGEASQQNREKIKAKNAAKPPKKKKLTPKEDFEASARRGKARVAHAANQETIRYNATQKKANPSKIDY